MWVLWWEIHELNKSLIEGSSPFQGYPRAHGYDWHIKSIVGGWSKDQSSSTHVSTLHEAHESIYIYIYIYICIYVCSLLTITHTLGQLVAYVDLVCGGCGFEYDKTWPKYFLGRLYLFLVYSFWWTTKIISLKPNHYFVECAHNNHFVPCLNGVLCLYSFKLFLMVFGLIIGPHWMMKKHDDKGSIMNNPKDMKCLVIFLFFMIIIYLMCFEISWTRLLQMLKSMF